MAKKALITGIAGQDGSWLAELLLDNGYEVHGIVRGTAIEDSEHKLKNLAACADRISLHTSSLDNVLSLIRIIRELRPDECYHLAASSFVSYSFEDEISILNNNVNGTHNLLAVLKEFVPSCRFYFAGSSEMFGQAPYSPQNEQTPFNPRSIYGISKVASYHLMKNYREQYGMFTCCGILYNHESIRRGYEFVTRKIVAAAARIKLGMQENLVLGNLDAVRDWGYAPDYVEAMRLMLQADSPDDYVIATGEVHSVREFAEIAFAALDLDYREYVTVNPKFFRPAEKIPLSGDPAKAVQKLNWQRTKSFEEIVREMVAHEMTLQQTAPAPFKR